jgi:hypothetical protein
MSFLNNRFAKFGMAIAWVAAAGSAQAYNVGEYVGNYLVGGGYVYEGSYLDTASAAVQNSTVVTERRTTTVATEAQANMVLSQIADRFDSRAVPVGSSVSLLPQSGGNAGADMHRGSLWARAGYDNMKEDNISSFGGWKANLWSFAIGYDHKFNDKTLAGLALTYSNLNGSTAFNKGNMKDNAFGIVPYLAFKINPCFDINLMLGYARVNKSRDRTTPSLTNINGGLTGVRATSSPKSDRYFGAVFANWRHYVNQWNLLARLGYLYATDKQKAFTEANGGVNLVGVNPLIADKRYNSMNTNVNRVSLRLQAGFKANPSVEPYAFLTYSLDFGATKMKVQDTTVANTSGIPALLNANRQRNNNTYGGGIGLNANLQGNWTAGIEAAYARSKKFQDIGGQLRIAKKF